MVPLRCRERSSEVLHNSYIDNTLYLQVYVTKKAVKMVNLPRKNNKTCRGSFRDWESAFGGKFQTNRISSQTENTKQETCGGNENI